MNGDLNQATHSAEREGSLLALVAGAISESLGRFSGSCSRSRIDGATC
jgi:hypothetical protein